MVVNACIYGEDKEDAMLSDLNGRIVMITGGGSGMGRATALRAAAFGAIVAIVDVNEDSARSVAAEVTAAGGRAAASAVDVRDVAAVRACVAGIESELGPIDGAVLCAGVSKPERAEDVTEDLWDDVIDVNLKGAFFCSQALANGMIERRRGSIVIIASTDAFSGQAGRAHYCASKYGVLGVVQTLAIEWGRHGVRVNAVAPGVVDTPMMRRNLPVDLVQDVLLDRTPLPRLPTAEDQANASLFLVSDLAACITGAILPVDGGLSAGYLTRWKGGDYGSKALLERGRYAPPVR